MSRIGKQPIVIPQGVAVEIEGVEIKVKGPQGTLERKIHPRIEIKREDNQLLVSPRGSTKLDKSLYGLTRTLIANMVKGVTQGFEKTLEITGLGYRAQKKGETLVLNLGFSHPVEIAPPEGISFQVEGSTIKVLGTDKEKVGQVAADIRKLRKPEPYKGTGIKYQSEHIRRKQGKTMAK